MEQVIVSKLVGQVADERLDVPGFFRACALAGISFAVAMAAVSATPAWSRGYTGEGAMPRAYSQFVSFDLAKATQVEGQQVAAMPTCLTPIYMKRGKHAVRARRHKRHHARPK
jgi:hypothetical protein